MKLTDLICLAAGLPLAASAGNFSVQELILCHSNDSNTIVVETWKPSRFGPPRHCLYASFSADMTACAPNGGWGLGSSNNMTNLVDAVNNWKTAHNHEAGKVAASTGTRGVRFVAQSGVGSNVNYKWRFSLIRSSGMATWYNKDGDLPPETSLTLM